MSSGPGQPPRMSIPAGRPAQMAKEMLSVALGSLQEIRSQGVDVQGLTGCIAKSVGALYAVQYSDPSDPAHVTGVRNAMGFLSQALGMLQDTQTTEPAVMETSRTIARVLAILYPVSRAQAAVTAPPQVVAAPATSAAPPRASRAIPDHPDRVKPRLACEVDIGFQSESNFFTGFSEDISEGGLFISTYDFKGIGASIDVNFTLPSGHTVMAVGVVRWVREINPLDASQLPGMGIQFTKLLPEDKKAIETYLSQRAPLFYEA